MKVLFWMSAGFDRHITSEHLLIAIIEQLCYAGNTVHVLQKNTGGDCPQLPKRLTSLNVTTDCVEFKIPDKNNFIGRYIAECKYIMSCKKYLKGKYDAVFIQSTTVGGLAVKEARKRYKNSLITFNVQDIFPYNALFSGNIKKKNMVFKILNGVQGYAYKYSDYVITISEDMKDLLIEAGVSADKIYVIYNWSYQDEIYDRGKLDFSKVSTILKEGYFNIVYAGNIGIMQNVDVVIEAAKLMRNNKDIWFHIIGDGIYKEKLKKRAKEYEIENISFWPMQSAEIAPIIYAGADVNIIPLVKNVYKTAFPSKTATCLACHKPIIFAIGKDSIFGQKIEKETGCPVIESNDAKGLKEAILLIKSKDIQVDTAGFFLKYCGKRKNSSDYVEIITKR